jgi:hypothetical protein
MRVIKQAIFFSARVPDVARFLDGAADAGVHVLGTTDARVAYVKSE